MNRRQILVRSAAGLALLAAGPGLLRGQQARAEEAPVLEDDRILGQADAPITIIEYASLTCPHCASFHRDTLPTIKKDWIEPGKARLVYRNFPLDGVALRAATLASCIEGDGYFSFVDALFRGQRQWALAQDPIAALARVARLAGIDQKTFDACISDKAEMNRILAHQVKAKETFRIKSTPTFIVNGRKVEGALTSEQFLELLAKVETQS